MRIGDDAPGLLPGIGNDGFGLPGGLQADAVRLRPGRGNGGIFGAERLKLLDPGGEGILSGSVAGLAQTVKIKTEH